MRDAQHQAWTLLPDGARITIHLTPKSGRDAVESIATQADGRQVLKMRVRAVPEDGKANAAALETLAKALGLSRSALKLESGAKSRTKTFRASGDPRKIDAALQKYLENS